MKVRTIRMFFSAFVSVLLWLPTATLSLTHAAESDPADFNLEIMQTNATLQYHAKDYKGAVSTLRQLLGKNSGDVVALELLALCQRQLGDDVGALTSYEKLFAVASNDRKPPYNFEVATIFLKQKNFERARSLFSASAEAGFNPGMSRYFMGYIDFMNKDWQSAHESLAAALTYDDSQSVSQTARYYLASTEEQLGRSDTAVHNYYEAVRPNVGTLSDSLKESALQSFKNLDRSQTFQMVSLISQYDSNVGSNPSSAPNPTPQSGQGSMKSIVNAGVGYVSSAAKDYQPIVLLKAFANYNLNQTTRDYQFASITPSFTEMVMPYKAFSYGLKTEGTYILKNGFDTNYSSYSLTGDIGPLVRFELTPSIRLGFEMTWRPKRFF